MNRPSLYPLFPSATALDRLFERALSGTPLVSRDYPPRERIEETESAYRITLDLPGLHREELKLDLKDRLLSLTITPTEERPFVAAESRRWTLGSEVEVSALTAQLDLGVLRIELPKIKPVTNEPQTIEIQ